MLYYKYMWAVYTIAQCYFSNLERIVAQARDNRSSCMLDNRSCIDTNSVGYRLVFNIIC